MYRLALLIAATTLACGDEPVEPHEFDEGTYIVQFDEVDGTACGFDSVYLRADAMEVGVTATLDGMRYTYPDATTDEDHVDCAMDGAAFNCDALTQVQALDAQGFDATITILLLQSGEWTDSDAHAGRFTYAFTCTGEDCTGGLGGSAYGADAGFPCELSGEYTGEKAD